MKKLGVVTLLVLGLLSSGLSSFAEDLHDAAQEGDLAKVKNLIAQRAGINAEGQHGETALHLAASHGRKQTVNFLLTCGAVVNVQDEDGNTPLHYAAGKGYLDVVELLLTAQADVRTRNSQHWGLLYLAGERDNIEIINILTIPDGKAGTWRNRGETPLHRAAQSGNLEIVQLLLTHGAEVNARNEYNGQTPLHIAAGQGNLAVVDLLLTHGADINARVALTVNPSDQMSYLLTPLHLAALAGRWEVTELLLAHRADVNTGIQSQENAARLLPDAYTDNYNRLADLGSLKGLTSLHCAVFVGQEAVVNTLLTHGADVEARDDSGRTPLHLASFWENTVAAAAQVLARGAIIDVRDNSGATPLQLAMKKGRKAPVELLLAYEGNARRKEKFEVKGPSVGHKVFPVRTVPLPTEREW